MITFKAKKNKMNASVCEKVKKKLHQVKLEVEVRIFELTRVTTPR